MWRSETTLALVGYGRAAERLYTPALRRLRGARVVAAADPVAGRRARFLEEFPDARAFDDLDALLGAVRPDGVLVLTPPALHARIAGAVLAAGVHCLLEKPMALTAAEAEALCATAAAGPARLMMAYNRRYWSSAMSLRDTLSGAALDAPHGSSHGAALDAPPGAAPGAAAATGPTPTGDPAAGWSLPGQRAGAGPLPAAEFLLESSAVAWDPIDPIADVLDDLVPHQLDLLRYLFARELHTVAARRPAAGTVELRVELEGGILAGCRAAHGVVYREQVMVRTAAGPRFLLPTSNRLGPAPGPLRRAVDLSDHVARRLSGRPSPWRASFERLLAAFACAAARGTAPWPGPGPEDGLAVVRAVEAVRQSIDGGGRTVAIA